MLQYLFLRLAVFLARRLPERWGVAIAPWFGRVVYRVSPVAKANRDNARHVLGPEVDPSQISQLARKAFENRLLNYYEMLRLSDLPLEEITRRMRIEGTEHIDRLVGEGRGAVITSGHMGPMELMIHGLGSLGYPLIAIAEHLEPERLHRYVMGLRVAHGFNMISTRASLLNVYRRVKRGEFLLSALDRDTTGTGLIVDFFGAPAWVPDGYARLAVRANVPVIVGFCRRAGNGAVAKIYAPIYPDKSLGKEEAVLDLIQRALKLFEAAIREYPEEWHLSTPIWQRAQGRLAPAGMTQGEDAE